MSDVGDWGVHAAIDAEAEVLSKRLYDLIVSQKASQVSVYASLHALAETVAMVISSSGNVSEAVLFFRKSLLQAGKMYARED